MAASLPAGFAPRANTRREPGPPGPAFPALVARDCCWVDVPGRRSRHLPRRRSHGDPCRRPRAGAPRAVVRAPRRGRGAGRRVLRAPGRDAARRGAHPRRRARARAVRRAVAHRARLRARGGRRRPDRAPRPRRRRPRGDLLQAGRCSSRTVPSPTTPTPTRRASAPRPTSSIPTRPGAPPARGARPRGGRIVAVASTGARATTPASRWLELARLMVALGCEHALNLDGGGSTR